MNIKVCLLPDGDDPDSFARKHNATDYQAYINDHEVDFIRFKTNLLMEEAGKDPIKRASLISSIVKSISVIPDAIVRSVYIRECSQLLQMEEKILVEATAKLIEQARENKFKEEQRRQYRERQLAATTPNTSTPASSTPAVSEGNATAGNDILFTASNDIPLLLPLKIPEIMESYPIFLLLKQEKGLSYLHRWGMKFQLIHIRHTFPQKAMSRRCSMPRKKT